MHCCKYKGVQVDIYIADETTWPTLVLIRTGSKEFNRMLCARAKQQGKILHADGSGIERVAGCDREERIIPETEVDIFHLLGLQYIHPRKREKGWN